MLHEVVLDGGFGNKIFQLRRAWEISKVMPSSRVRLRVIGRVDNRELSCLTNVADVLGLETLSQFSSAVPRIYTITRLKRSVSERSGFCYFRDGLTRTRQNDTVLHHGYWQSSPRLSAPEDEFDAALAQNFRISGYRQIALHIRGGDYREPKNRRIYNQISICSVKRGIDHLKRDENLPIIAVTNDKLLAQSTIADLGISATVISNDDPMRDFEILASSSHVLVSNSTFGWWAIRLGLLNGSVQKIAAPTHWMMADYEHRSHPKFEGPYCKAV